MKKVVIGHVIDKEKKYNSFCFISYIMCQKIIYSDFLAHVLEIPHNLISLFKEKNEYNLPVYPFHCSCHNL